MPTTKTGAAAPVIQATESTASRPAYHPYIRPAAPVLAVNRVIGGKSLRDMLVVDYPGVRKELPNDSLRDLHLTWRPSDNGVAWII